MSFLIIVVISIFGICLSPADKAFSLESYADGAPRCNSTYGLDVHKENHLVGKFSTANCSDGRVQKAVKTANLAPEDVYGVTSQIVAGTKYVIYTNRRESSCCRVPVWSQPSGKNEVVADEVCCDDESCARYVEKC